MTSQLIIRGDGDATADTQLIIRRDDDVTANHQKG